MDVIVYDNISASNRTIPVIIIMYILVYLTMHNKKNLFFIIIIQTLWAWEVYIPCLCILHRYCCDNGIQCLQGSRTPLMNTVLVIVVTWDWVTA